MIVITLSAIHMMIVLNTYSYCYLLIAHVFTSSFGCFNGRKVNTSDAPCILFFYLAQCAAVEKYIGQRGTVCSSSIDRVDLRS